MPKKKTKKKVTKKKASKATKPKVGQPHPDKVERAFMIEMVPNRTMTLYRVVFLTICHGKVIERVEITEPDMKATTLHRLRFLSYQLYFEEKIPTKEQGVVAI